MIHLRTYRLALAATTFLSISGTAFALDGTDLVTKINAAYSLQGASIKPDSVTVDGTSVTLVGVTVVATGNPQGLKVGDVKMDGVADDGKGGYTIETVTFPNVSSTNEGVTVTASNLTLGGVTIPADATKNDVDSLIMYETGHAGPVSITKDGKEVASLAETTANMTARDDKSGFDFDFAATGLKADLTTVDDPKSKEVIDKLALQTIDGGITMNGSWDLKPGTIDIEEFAFDFKNVGRLNLAFGLSGYTLDLVRQMQESLKAMEANPNKEEAQQATGLAMMGLMQQMTFDSASISFEDDSITKRVLEYVGSQQGMSGDQFAQALKAMVPIGVAQLNIPELQAAVTTAVTAYLDDPKSLTISAAPEKPVAFPVIMGAAMGAPNTLPQVLGVTVSANDDM